MKLQHRYALHNNKSQPLHYSHIQLNCFHFLNSQHWTNDKMMRCLKTPDGAELEKMLLERLKRSHSCNILLTSIMSSLTTHNFSVSVIPTIITHGTPQPIETYLYPPIIVCFTTKQSNISLIAFLAIGCCNFILANPLYTIPTNSKA